MIEFRDVTFTYPPRPAHPDEDEEETSEEASGENSREEASEKDSKDEKPNGPVLAGVSFVVPAGKTVAIVGHSGAGAFRDGHDLTWTDFLL